MINNYNPEIGEYVKHRFDITVKGIVDIYDGSGAMVYLTLHDGNREFKTFVDNLEYDSETFREHKLKYLLCQGK